LKNIKFLINIILLFFFSFIYAQNNLSESVIEPFQKEALLREKVFIHLNKTVYFIGENIWFTSYIAEDSDNSPSHYTSNLQVNLLNQNGEIIDTKDIFTQKGVGYGSFSIDDTLKTGKYYIQAATTFMLNFGEDNAFIQEINIVNPLEKESMETQGVNKYDIQLFPESGYLLENAKNSMGIKVLINGRGYAFTGAILNSKGSEITTFDGNEFGLGKCEFFYSKNESYIAVIDINNTVKKINIPKAHKTGVIFSIDNSNPEQIKLTLITNKETLPILKKESLALLIYRNNYISEALNLSLKNSEQVTQDLFFDKGKMQNGVNIVTLFKNNKPIAERKFFIDKLDKQTAILIEKLKSTNDSISFKIKTLNANYEPVASQISISVLTENSKVFLDKQNIKSAFLLSPYIKGRIDNPAYYLKNINPNQTEYLDLLLLNQGWSNYSLEEKIKEINPKMIFDFESGFTVKGKINKIPRGYNIGIVSKKERLIAISELNVNKEFHFENVFGYKNDSISLTLIKKGSPLVKPNQVELIKEKHNHKNYDHLTSQFYPLYIFKDTMNSTSVVENDLDNYRYPNSEVIDEVVLNTKVSKKKITSYDKEMNLAKVHNEIASEYFQSKKVTEQMETSSNTLFEYFRGLGYIKRTTEGSYFISLRNAPVTLFGAGKNPDHSYPPQIFVDNTMVPNGDIEMFKSLYMFDIDEILINKSGAGGGMDAGGGIIKIYLKKGNHKYFDKGAKNLYKNLLLLTGFDKAESYYNPQYNIYSKEMYDWTEIDWKPSLKTNNNGEIIIKVPKNEFSNDFMMIINGFSENGLLFHDIYYTGVDDF